MYDLVLRDATIVTSSGRQVADVAVKKGRIRYVGARPPRRAREEISAIGKFLIPGVIDTAVQFDPKGDGSIFAPESSAAVTGGITTVVCLPEGETPVVDSRTARSRARRINGHSFCHYGLWGGATADNADQLHEAAREGAILASLARVGHIEDRPHITEDQLSEHLQSDAIYGVQPSTPEASERTISYARETDRPIHIVHLSTAGELNLIDPVRGKLPVTAGVTPHHLFLSTEGMDELGAGVKTVPPVRPEHDRRTLWTAIKRGRLDCLASDHHAEREGRLGGVPGSELLFPLMLSAVVHGRLSLEQLVSLCSEAPAKIFGLESKGRIARGADADMVLFSEGDLTRVGKRDLLSGAGWSPYLHREAAPKPELVVVGGHVVARRGELLDETPRGSLLQRSA